MVKKIEIVLVDSKKNYIGKFYIKKNVINIVYVWTQFVITGPMSQRQ